MVLAIQGERSEAEGQKAQGPVSDSAVSSGFHPSEIAIITSFKALVGDLGPCTTHSSRSLILSDDGIV